MADLVLGRGTADGRLPEPRADRALVVEGADFRHAQHRLEAQHGARKEQRAAMGVVSSALKYLWQPPFPSLKRKLEGKTLSPFKDGDRVGLC